jgi:hypothetical protein
MAADPESGVPMPPNEDDEGRTLFAYEAAHEGRLVTRLVGIGGSNEDVRVVAEVYPVHAPATSEPQWRFYDFPTHERARRFADEAMLTLEYLGCAVTETAPHAAAAAAGRVMAGAAA